MRKLLLLIGLFVISNYQLLLSQPTFTFKIHSEYTDTPLDIIEGEDAYYATFAFMSYDTVYSYIRKFDYNGDSIKQVRLCKDSLKVMCGNMVINDEGNIVIVGFARNTYYGKYSIMLFELTPDLEIVKTNACETSFMQIGFTDLIKDNKSYIYSGDYTNGNEENIFTFRFDANFQLLGANTFNDSYKFHFSTAIDPISRDIKLAVCGSVLNGTSGNFYIIDSLLQLRKIDTITKKMLNYYELRYINDTMFYLSGKDVTEGADDNYRIVLMDTSYHIYKDVTFGAIDTFDYPGLDRNMSFLQPNRVYCGLTRNIAEQIPIYSTNKSWYGVYLLDDSLNIRWKRFYGGDAYYMLRQIEATTDGGCLLAGRRYDYLTQDMEFDIVIVKMDSTGLITSAGQEPEILSHDAIVYPNPGNNVLHIESGPQISGAMFYLYDLAGKMLEQKKLNGQTETLQTSALPNGVYLWNIVYNNNTIEGGKWVKAD
jgi:hypothetical protein